MTRVSVTCPSGMVEFDSRDRLYALAEAVDAIRHMVPLSLARELAVKWLEESVGRGDDPVRFVDSRTGVVVLMS